MTNARRTSARIDRSTSDAVSGQHEVGTRCPAVLAKRCQGPLPVGDDEGRRPSLAGQRHLGERGGRRRPPASALMGLIFSPVPFGVDHVTSAVGRPAPIRDVVGPPPSCGPNRRTRVSPDPACGPRATTGAVSCSHAREYACLRRLAAGSARPLTVAGAGLAASSLATTPRCSSAALLCRREPLLHPAAGGAVLGHRLVLRFFPNRPFWLLWPSARPERDHPSVATLPPGRRPARSA